MQPDGQPFFWLGENAWELFQRPDKDEVEMYLADRARKGFTVLLAVVGGVHPEPNRYGELPLIDFDPMRPNPKYFENVDWIVARAAHYGMRVAMVTAWSPGDTKATIGYGDAPKIFNVTNSKIYARWLGERYRDKGVIWILGGDSNPLWPEKGLRGGSIVDLRPIYEAMAQGLKEGQGPQAFITFHPSCCSFRGTAPPRTSIYLGDRPWLTMNMLQSSHYRNPAPSVVPRIGFDFSWLALCNYIPISAEYVSIPTRPVVDGEALFEDLGVDNDPSKLEVKGFWTGRESRIAGYHAVFAGAAGHTYGNHAVWQFYNPARNKPDPPARLDLPWQAALERPVSGQFKHLKELMLSRPYYDRIPDPALIVGEHGEGEQYISATRDRSGHFGMVYLPTGQSVTVDMTKVSGNAVVAWWFDPLTGDAKRVEGMLSTAHARKFSPPARHGADRDWVLVLDDASQHFSVPGSLSGASLESVETARR